MGHNDSVQRQGEQTPQSRSDAEIAGLLHQIREINRRHREGKISREERVRLHNLLVPGIGKLEGAVLPLTPPPERKRLR